MESDKVQEDSLSKVNIIKPKAVRRCKKSKKLLKSSISSTSSGSKKSSEIKIFDGEEQILNSIISTSMKLTPISSYMNKKMKKKCALMN